MDQLNAFVTGHWVLVLALFVILGLLINSFLSERGVTPIQPLQMVEAINRQNAAVLDVRTDEEFKSGRILNSIHIPVGVLANRLPELDKYKDRPIVVVCRTGQRSQQACSILRKQGFGSVYKLQGGILTWQNANLPLVKA